MTIIKTSARRSKIALAVFALCLSDAALAQDDVTVSPEGTLILEEIVVTARKREELLQDVPDSITAFTANDVETAGIDDIEDFINLTPNLTVREAFRAGITFITLRGVTTGQQGWAPVTFVVDGVQAGSLDAINQGALLDIEQIEVLKGPQGSLYGAGAIAGAINVTTKEPGEEAEGQVKLRYGNGNDRTISAFLSGSLNSDNSLRGLISVYDRDADGLIDSTAGEDLDFEDQSTVRGRLIYEPSDNLSFDLRASYSDIEAGAAFQEKLFSANDIDQFDTDTTPGPFRGIAGVESREFTEVSLKVDWETSIGTITSVTGYSDIEQDLLASLSFDDPLRPGASGFLPFPIGGVFELSPLGLPGNTLFDQFQGLQDNFESFTQDIRFVSNSDGALRWLVGASYQDRETLNELNVGFVLNSADGSLFPLGFIGFPRFDVRNDKAVGVYGQLDYDLSDRFTLTLGGRYDENDYDTSQFSDEGLSNPVSTVDVNGNAVNTLTNTDDQFQPKATLAYEVSDDTLVYATYAEGFRYGFFNTGNLTQAETTENFEVGFKTSVGAWNINAAAFYIDYSDQQFTTVIVEAPFRTSVNIPETTIKGVEVEWKAAISDSFEFYGGLGYIDAEQDNGLTSPATPDYTLNLGGIYSTNLGGYDFTSRLDVRQQGEYFIGFAEDFRVESKAYVNWRSSLSKGNWAVAAYVNNLLDEQQANDFTAVNDFFVRAQSKPISYGLEVSYSY